MKLFTLIKNLFISEKALNDTLALNDITCMSEPELKELMFEYAQDEWEELLDEEYRLAVESGYDDSANEVYVEEPLLTLEAFAKLSNIDKLAYVNEGITNDAFVASLTPEEIANGLKTDEYYYGDSDIVADRPWDEDCKELDEPLEDTDVRETRLSLEDALEYAYDMFLDVPEDNSPEHDCSSCVHACGLFYDNVGSCEGMEYLGECMYVAKARHKRTLYMLTDTVQYIEKAYIFNTSDILPEPCTKPNCLGCPNSSTCIPF